VARLSILIPTAPRPESLRLVLRCLRASAEPADIVVIDNGPTASLTPQDVQIEGIPSVRLLHEPRPGKAHALNRGLGAASGDLVAVLDDDMVPADGWADAVVAAAGRRPEFDLFAGRSHVVWPAGEVIPSWAHHGLAQGVCFSVVDFGADGDREMGAGRLGYPSGNHFWFRRRVLRSVPAFPDVWPPELDFVLAARSHGHRGVFVPEVRCGHRVQASLLDPAVFVDRAARFGFAMGRVDDVQRAIRGDGSRRPLPRVLRRCAWTLRSWGWRVRGALSLCGPEAARVPARARAVLRSAYWHELVRRLS